LFEASLASDGTSLQVGSQLIALNDAVFEANSGLAAYKGRKVVVGLRAEDMPIVEGDQHEGSVLQGHVEAVEALGSELLVHFSIDAVRISPETFVEESSDEFVGVAPIAIMGEGVARVQPRAIVTVGRNASFTVFPERLYFFDPETQDAITK
jgi:multiple sugar transport system ATP-binding protein